MPDPAQIWAGVCDTEAVLHSLVAETFSEDDEDDLPVSAFVASQGQTWLDHDFMETLWSDPGDTLAEQFAGASYIEIWGDAAALQIKAKQLHGINGLILVFDRDGAPQIANPRDANGPGWRLVYLGRF